jgi:hypothetical protein
MYYLPTKWQPLDKGTNSRSDNPKQPNDTRSCISTTACNPRNKKQKNGTAIANIKTIRFENAMLINLSL